MLAALCSGIPAGHAAEPARTPDDAFNVAAHLETPLFDAGKAAAAEVAKTDEFELILLSEDLKSSWLDLPLPYTAADLIEDGAIGDTSGLVNPFDRELLEVHSHPPPGFWDRFSSGLRDWTSRFIVGGRYLAGNSNQSAIDVAADFEKKLERRASQINLGGQFGETKNVVVANRWFANSTTDFYFGDHWLVFLRALDQYDQLQNLDYRGTFSIGPGYRFVNDDRHRFVVRAGPGVTTELYHDPFLHRTTPDLFGEVEIRWPLWERLKWEQKSSVFPSVSNFEIARAQSQTSLFYALDEQERWSVRLGFIYQYNSQLTTGREPSDYTTNVSVVYQRK